MNILRYDNTYRISDYPHLRAYSKSYVYIRYLGNIPVNFRKTAKKINGKP